MINKLKIALFYIKNKYYLHLIYSIFFFLRKKFNKEIKYKEKLSYILANKICEKNKTSKKKIIRPY